MSAQPRAADDSDHRLVLWNIGLTLLDAARVNRAAYAEAFRAVTGRPLVQVPQMAGRTDSEIFFEALAVNATGLRPGDPAGEELLGAFAAQLAAAFRARRDLLTTQGQLMPGALEAVTGVWRRAGLERRARPRGRVAGGACAAARTGRPPGAPGPGCLRAGAAQGHPPGLRGVGWPARARRAPRKAGLGGQEVAGPAGFGGRRRAV